MNCKIIKKFCRPYLRSIHGDNWCFSLYTSHDVSHSFAVWKNAKQIASNKLSEMEILFLKAACMCHDLGMTKFDDNDIIWEDPEYCEYIRKNHHIRSRNFINKFKNEMELDFKEAQILGEICYSHSSKVDLNKINNFHSFKTDIIRTRLLGAILRISDALDASIDRIPQYDISEVPFESKIEYLKHMIVNNVSINNEKITLELSKEPEEHVGMIKDKLIEEFSSVKDILKSMGIVYKIKFVYTKSKVNESSLEFIPSDVERIMKLYVKPSNFNEIYKKLESHNIVIVSGDANVGKTSTAHYIAGFRWKTYKNPIKIYRPGMRIESPKNYTIIIDDAFGETELDDRVSLSYHEIMRLKEDNLVILTSRKQVLTNALNKIRLSEADYENWKVEIGQEGSYSDEALKEILFNHLKYYLESRKISTNEINIAKINEDKIIKSLRFPHNIDIFVKEKLNEISNEGKNLLNAINEAKYIYRVAKNWFLNLDDTSKFFVFIIWMFPTRIEFLKIIYPPIINTLKDLRPNLEIGDLNELVLKTSSYIVHDTEYSFNEDRIHIKHPNYVEGISEAIKNTFEIYIRALVPVFKIFYQESSYFFIDSLNDSLIRIAYINHEWAFDLIKKILENADWKIKTNISRTIGKLIYVKENESIALLKVFVTDEDWKVRECVPNALITDFLEGSVDFKNFIDESFEMLEILASDEDWRVKASVASSLGKFGSVEPNESIRILNKLAKDKEVEVKVKVASSLGKLGSVEPNESINILNKLAKDEEGKVRQEVVNALIYEAEGSLNNDNNFVQLGFLKHEVSFKLLEKLAFDDNSNVMECAIRAMILCLIDVIAYKTHRSSEIIDILKRLSSDNDFTLVITDSLNEFSHLIDEENFHDIKSNLSDIDYSKINYYEKEKIDTEGLDEHKTKIQMNDDNFICSVCGISLKDDFSISCNNCYGVFCENCLISVGKFIIKCPKCGYIGDNNLSFNWKLL